MSYRLLLCGLLGVVTACGIGGTAAAEDVAMTVCSDRATAYDAAMETGDPSKMGPLFLSDAVTVGAYGISEGREAIAATYQGFVKPGVKHGHAVKGGRPLGNVVMCWGEWTFTFAPGSPAKGLAGRYTAIYAKVEEGWRIESLSWNLLPPPPAKTN